MPSDGDDGTLPKEPYVRYVEALQSWYHHILVIILALACNKTINSPPFNTSLQSRSRPLCQQRLSDTEWTDLLGGTAERLFGPFEPLTTSSSSSVCVSESSERVTELPPPPPPGPVAVSASQVAASPVATPPARTTSGISIISRIALLLVTFFHTIKANLLPSNPRMSNVWGPIPSLRLFQPHHRRAIDSFLREKENVPFNHPFIGLSRDCDFHCKGDLTPLYAFLNPPNRGLLGTFLNPPNRGLLGTPHSDDEKPMYHLTQPNSHTSEMYPH